MAAVLLACQMLEDEIQRAVQRTGAQMPIVWVDAGLHEYPDRLREELQRQIALLEQDYDTILLGFCLCGNALHGVRAARARLIAPRFDDCIRMLSAPPRGRPRPLIAAVCTIRRPGLATAAQSWTNTTRLRKNMVRKRPSGSMPRC